MAFAALYHSTGVRVDQNEVWIGFRLVIFQVKLIGCLD